MGLSFGFRVAVMTFEFSLMTESFSLNWVEVSFVSGLVFRD